MTVWTRLSKKLFPKSSLKMIDDNQKRKRRLAFDLQRFFEKCSNTY